MSKRKKEESSPIVRAFRLLADAPNVFVALRELPSRAERLRVLDAITALHGLESAP